MSAEQQSVSVGERVSVSCNVSGHPQPELHWLNKHNGRTVVRVYGHIHTHIGSFDHPQNNMTPVNSMLPSNFYHSYAIPAT